MDRISVDRSYEKFLIAITKEFKMSTNQEIAALSARLSKPKKSEGVDNFRGEKLEMYEKCLINLKKRLTFATFLSVSLIITSKSQTIEKIAHAIRVCFTCSLVRLVIAQKRLVIDIVII
jgi:hypothetical protein